MYLVKKGGIKCEELPAKVPHLSLELVVIHFLNDFVCGVLLHDKTHEHSFLQRKQTVKVSDMRQRYTYR